MSLTKPVAVCIGVGGNKGTAGMRVTQLCNNIQFSALLDTFVLENFKIT